MLKEFVESISRLAIGGTEPKVIPLPGGKVMLLTPIGSDTLDADRKTHADALVSLTSVLEWCHSYDEAELVIGVSDVAISVSQGRDHPYDSDTATMKLQHSAAYADLLDWCKTARSLTQVVKSLRSKLYGTYDPSYLSILRQLDFKRKNDGSKTVAHTGESMGKSVEMAAQSSAGEIPEMLSFSVYLFDGIPSETSELRFALTVDPANETVAIASVGDCIGEAHRVTRVSLVDRLNAEFPEAMVLETV